MTGDGVNDVLALKEADCSIAMAAGSDAAKNCSNLVLLDSNFSSMPYIVKEGRRVINNIQSAALALFLVKTIFSLVLSIFTLMFTWQYPFIPIQLSVISMCGVGIPTFILALEPNFNRVRGDFLRNVLQNALTGALTIVAEVILITILCGYLKSGAAVRSTMCVLATGVVSLYMIRKVYPLQSKLRKAVYYAMFGLFFCCLFVLPPLFSVEDIPFREMIVLLLLLIFTPYLIDGIYGAMEWVKSWWRKMRLKWKEREHWKPDS